MFFSIDHARFIYAQLLAAPRLAPFVDAVAPQIESKLLYARTREGREIPVLASGEIPSRTSAVGAGPPIAAGSWSDDGDDVAWRDPRPDELRQAIDHFHLPPDRRAHDPTWAEWHYFNVLSSDAARWAFVSFIVAGEVPNGRWGGQILVTLHQQGGPSRRFVATVPPSAIQILDERRGSRDWSVERHRARRRTLRRARIREGRTRARLGARQSRRVARARRVLPRRARCRVARRSLAMWCPGLRADAVGSICVAQTCEQFEHAQSYHDHNWGVWRGVTLGVGRGARGRSTRVLYGRVQPPDSVAASQPLFVYVVDSLGFLSLFRPREIRYDDAHMISAWRDASARSVSRRRWSTCAATTRFAWS